MRFVLCLLVLACLCLQGRLAEYVTLEQARGLSETADTAEYRAAFAHVADHIERQADVMPNEGRPGSAWVQFYQLKFDYDCYCIDDMDFSISHRHPGSLLITLAYAGHLLSVKVANKFLVHRLSILQNTGDAVTVSLTNIERPTDPGWVDCCSHIQRWHIKFEAWYDSATMVTEYSALYCYPSEASFYMNTCTRKILREIMPETVTQCSCPLNEVVNPAAGAYGAKIGWKGYEFRSSPDSTSSLRVRGVPMEEIASLA